ncbi:FadR/GntR family transcriptional regulator [Brevundimonas sp. SL130]|jgi:GntR family transcriptional repressor for pyruvate dehydrogenase complex|uniref:FadR/GntR family transcriptional regulator n=1 Tax=Brevundimonas sp. SL130 TaxID=2995143 RepID=UPI00226D330B|nr:FCD domain-containing protein [Brevundimonas sp. SL130]WAC59031.1 FCD domain-containing protein [Brevundimonas sp. SL130]
MSTRHDEPTNIEADIDRLRAFVEAIAGEGDGGRLPPEPRLSETLGISRGRLRTLLKRLEDEGRIWRHVGKGTFAGPRRVAAADNSWAASVSVDDIMDARLLLEPQLAAQAAVHATPADITGLQQCLTEMSAPPSFLHWKRLDEKLHRAIAVSTHNVLLLMLYDSLRSQIHARLDGRLETVYGATASSAKTVSDDEHQACVDAIAAHDPTRAEQAMRDHLRSVRTHLFGLR